MWAIQDDFEYHPSNLLQADCMVWFEGLSDGIYLNHLLFCDFIVFYEINIRLCDE